MKRFVVILICLGVASLCSAQGDSAAQTQGEEQTTPSAPLLAPSPLATPPITGPLKAPSPNSFDAGPFGKLNLNGSISGIGLWQGNYFPGDDATQAALSNGQVFLQKSTGWWQFFVQAGAYNLPAVGIPFLKTEKTVSDLYGPVPVAFLKLVPGENTSIQMGALPTVMGAEYTFTFQNMNVGRGLLWYQENAVNHGIQVNQTIGKFTASLSWNDGYYSNRYSWLSGSLTYAHGPHSVVFSGMANLGETVFQSLATPVQNNSSMYAVLYTYTKGPWIIQPWYQYNSVPANNRIGILKGNTTQAGALLVSYGFKHGFSLPARWEYIASTGSANDPDSVNLMYGPGSKATSITVTPTFQHKGFFVRGDLSYVHASDITPGLAFGRGGNRPSQLRAIAEFGFLF